jgi:hypothetical protein
MVMPSLFKVVCCGLKPALQGIWDRQLVTDAPDTTTVDYFD